MFFRYSPQASPSAYQSGDYLYGHPMMGWFGANGSGMWFFGIAWLVTWILVIAVLVALVRWLWKKGDKVK
ncbi:MAG: hypothetical protein NUV69_03905 [Candidatus Curtissbacteria bacterium]|nr:hypothetical protein [Candidatus Curtissbacteria bacterium]